MIRLSANLLLVVVVEASFSRSISQALTSLFSSSSSSSSDPLGSLSIRMSALVCGRSSSSSLLPKTSSHAHLISKKRLRCSSTSPIQRSPSTTKTNNNNNSTNNSTSAESVVSSVVVADTLLDRLQFIFPAMEMKVLEQSGGDFESAIMSLIQLCLGVSSSADVDDDDDQNYWLFQDQNKRSKQVSDDDNDDVVHVASSAGYGNIGTTWPPRACYLPEADVYALPYTVPF